MNGLAALAVKEAAVASGLGASLLPGIAPSAVDGFAVGTLLSGVCFLLVMAPRRGLRRARSSSGAGQLANAAYSAPHTAGSVPVTVSDPFADEATEVVVPALPTAAGLPSLPGHDEAASGPDGKGNGYRSKHRMSGTGNGTAERRPEAKRCPPRHAAPSVSLGSRMAGRLPLHPVAARN